MDTRTYNTTYIHISTMHLTPPPLTTLAFQSLSLPLLYSAGTLFYLLRLVGGVSGSGDVAADDQRDDAREEVGLRISGPWGLLVYATESLGTCFSLLLHAAVDTCELGEIGLYWEWS